MQLAQLVGQTRAVAVLRNAIWRDRVAHAYLFWGPEGVGKSTAALAFAQALACLGSCRPEAGESCGECQSCKLVAGGSHPDVRIISVAAGPDGSGRTEISIQQIRQDPTKPRVIPRPLVQDAYLRPAFGRFKVYIIDPADRMSAEAANALLHVLEEPPPLVVLVLVTANPSAMLPTVVSRCQQVAFQLAGVAAIESHLRGLKVAPEVASALARLSGGRIAWAIGASQQPDILATRDGLLDLCADLSAQKAVAGLRIAEEIRLLAAGLTEAGVQDRADETDGSEQENDEPSRSREAPVRDRALRRELPWCLDVMASWYRDWLAAAHGSPPINPDRAQEIRAIAARQGPQQAEAAIEVILATKRYIQRQANVDLALEHLAVSLLGLDEGFQRLHGSH